MRNCELLSTMSVQAGTASNLARDLNTRVILDGEVLKVENFDKVRVIRERLQAALAAATALEQLCIIGRPSNFHESEQIQIFR